jgi:hypothetical protein
MNKEAAKSLDDATDEADERRKQREAPVRRLKQVVKESCHSDLARHFDEVDCETPLKQGPVRQYVLVAVAAASPSTTRLPLTKPRANIPVSIVRR